MWITSSLDTIKTPTVIALGNFDGIHRGHQQVIRPILPAAIAVSVEAIATVVTFTPHPEEFFTGQTKLLLTPIPEKVSLLQALGVQQLVLLPFTQPLAHLTPVAFVEEILLTRLQARHISVGADFRFGRRRTGTATDLAAIAAQANVSTTIVPLYTEHNQRISSSAIRTALALGDLATANHLLGRPYSLRGTVVTGQQLGRTLGFPTANLHVPPEKFLPSDGVYGVQVGIETGPEATITQWLPGVMNIGYRPTVAGRSRSLEVHVLDWSGDLYGQTLVVQCQHFLRSEQKFASLPELKQQIQRDCAAAKMRLAVGDPSGTG